MIIAINITCMYGFEDALVIFQVGQFIQNISSFLGGFVIAFVRGWLLTLVLLCSVPPIAISGALMMKLLSTLSSHEQTAYSQAATIVEQTIGSIRTVRNIYRVKTFISCCFNGIIDVKCIVYVGCIIYRGATSNF